MKLFLLPLIIFSCCLSVNAQYKEKTHILDSVWRRDVIKLNPTQILIYNSKNIVLAWEHAIKPYQAFEVKAGFFSLPQIVGDTISGLLAITGRESNGFQLGGSYRFYMKKRNKHKAPDGLYLGGFTNYYYNSFENTLNLYNPTQDFKGVVLDGTVNIWSVGFELGYQFVFKRHLTIDLVLVGPNITHLAADFKLKGNWDAQNNEEFMNGLYSQLVDRYPPIGEFIKKGHFNASGVIDRWVPFYKYIVQIGWNF